MAGAFCTNDANRINAKLGRSLAIANCRRLVHDLDTRFVQLRQNCCRRGAGSFNESDAFFAYNFPMLVEFILHTSTLRDAEIDTKGRSLC